jgi:hypothetical protein
VSPALIAVAITALTVAVGAIVLGRAAHRGPSPSGESRPWWGAPGPWIAASAVLLVLGLVVFPRLLGFVVLFLPFVWMRRARRPTGWDRRPEDREEP